MRSLTEEDSKRITSLRFLLIVFVVFIHNNLNADDAINYYHLAFNEPAVITWFKFLVTSVLGGAAVPLFFLFAGYLQFCKQDSYPVLLKKRAKSLLVPYVAWTVITVALFFIAQSVPQLSAFFQNENNIVRNWNFTDWISLFWVHNEVYPLVYQFWFLRNLIVLVLFSPILVLLARKMPFLVIVGISLCFLNGIPLGFGTALFFYMAGFFFAEYDISFFKIADKIKWVEFGILFLAILIFNIAFAEKIQFYGINTLISCFFFLKLSAIIVSKEKLFAVSHYLAGFSFFLYAIHAPFLGTSLNKLNWRIIPLHGAWCLVQFIVPCVLCIAIGTGIGIALKKILPPLFAILNGSRK